MRASERKALGRKWDAAEEAGWVRLALDADAGTWCEPGLGTLTTTLVRAYVRTRKGTWVVAGFERVSHSVSDDPLDTAGAWYVRRDALNRLREDRRDHHVPARKAWLTFGPDGLSPEPCPASPASPSYV